MASLKFLLIWCLISSQVTDGAATDACHTEISFLQAELRMTPLTQTDPEIESRSPNSRGSHLNLLGRSFFSEDPQNSANFWIKYSTSMERKDDDLHHGTTVGLHESLENDAVVVKRSDGMPAEKLYFLKVPDPWLICLFFVGDVFYGLVIHRHVSHHHLVRRVFGRTDFPMAFGKSRVFNQ